MNLKIPIWPSSLFLGEVQQINNGSGLRQLFTNAPRGTEGKTAGINGEIIMVDKYYDHIE